MLSMIGAGEEDETGGVVNGTVAGVSEVALPYKKLLTLESRIHVTTK